MKPVRIQFDSNQQYQIDAVNAVVDLFDGLSKQDEREFTLSNESDADLRQLASDVVANTDEFFDDRWLLDNLAQVQQRNGLPVQTDLSEPNSGETLLLDDYSYPEFTVNMETGTGKTYVYLRTIYALRAKYGFKKFIIVVPSIAIYEGTVSSFHATKDHFRTLFNGYPGTVPQDIIQYDGSASDCKNFALSDGTQIMLMTIASFNKVKNIIYKESDKLMGGKLPIEYVQETRPVLILDEVQNYQTPLAKSALRTLHPLFSVGYSATPKGPEGELPPNVVYNLSPFAAMQMNLVKKIEICGKQEEEAMSNRQDFFKVQGVTKSRGNGLTVALQVLVNDNGSLKQNTLPFKVGDSLRKKTKNDAYGDLKIENIIAKKGSEAVDMSSGIRYLLNEYSCANLSKEAIFREMIHETIKAHIEKERVLETYGYKAKVLSLFFVDKVANYAGKDALIKKLFNEEFESLKEQSSCLKNISAEDVQAAYFAANKAATSEEDAYLDLGEEGGSNEAERQAEKEAYQLIMQQKEKLLSTENPVHFIFAHSALREGWDNPNVFQICSLREISSENSRRQSIGRGLRLPVQEGTEDHPELAGTRIQDPNINKLTLVAHEDFNRFVEALYKEYEDAGCEVDKGHFGNARRKVFVKRTKMFESDDFKKLWKKVNQQTEYTIHINKDSLVKTAVAEINKIDFKPPQIVTTRGDYVVTKYRFTVLEVLQTKTAKILVEISDTQGRTYELNRTEFPVKEHNRLQSQDPLLSAVQITKIDAKKRCVEISKWGNPLQLGVPVEIEANTTRISDPDDESSNKTEAKVENLPVPNILERVAKEIPLTRKTILEIFKGIDQEKSKFFLLNPEAFIGKFIESLKEVLANHIAENIEYTPTGSDMGLDPKVVFPANLLLPDTELADADIKKSIYEKIQVDSNVERNFVGTLNKSSYGTGNVSIYFKFPGSYIIKIPKIIQNYNPDWAIARIDEGNHILHLVRETKGTENIKNLPHTNEARKIVCGAKHFEAVGIDYDFVDDKEIRWFETIHHNLAQSLLNEPEDNIIPVKTYQMIQHEYSNVAEKPKPYKV